MQVEEISFITDVIQDSRSDARTQQAYEYLIDAIFNNAKLNWTNDGLILKSDEKFFTIVEMLEPDMYRKAVSKLQQAEIPQKTK